MDEWINEFLRAYQDDEGFIINLIVKKRPTFRNSK